MIANQFPPSEWNIYCFQFSDGDNWGEDNETQPGAAPRARFCRSVNLFCYGQVESPYGSGEYIRSVRQAFRDGEEKLVIAEIENKEAIYDALKRFWAKEFKA